MSSYVFTIRKHQFTLVNLGFAFSTTVNSHLDGRPVVSTDFSEPSQALVLCRLLALHDTLHLLERKSVVDLDVFA